MTEDVVRIINTLLHEAQQIVKQILSLVSRETLGKVLELFGDVEKRAGEIVTVVNEDMTKKKDTKVKKEKESDVPPANNKTKMV